MRGTPDRSARVSTGKLEALGGQAAGLDGVGLRWFTASDQKAAFGKLIIDATEAIVADAQQSRDGFAWFRNNRRDVEREPVHGRGAVEALVQLAAP